MPLLVEVAPDHPCDRCEHPSKWHAGPEHWSECRVVDGRFYRGETISKGMRARKCPCDGYFPKQ